MGAVVVKMGLEGGAFVLRLQMLELPGPAGGPALRSPAKNKEKKKTQICLPERLAVK